MHNTPLFVAIVMCSASFATFADAPVLNLNVVEHQVTATWSATSNASHYLLYYAPYPAKFPISTLDVGQVNRLSVTLQPGDAYYVAVQGVMANTTGPISNIEYFTVPAQSTKTWYQPQVGVSWQIQLTDTVNSNYAVELYDIDLFDSSKELISQLKNSGKKVICYFSAGTYENWRSDQANFSNNDLGSPLADWPGEKWLDIRSAKVFKIMEARLDLAVSKGCDGVDPDNVNGYTNSTGFKLTANDQLLFNKNIAQAAHVRGLAVGLKNDLEQVDALVSYFDFSLNEQCHEYNECSALNQFITAQKPVLNIEYAAKYRSNSGRQALCQQAQLAKFSTLILPIELNDQFRSSC